jgi:glycosyltransferase involved in cell wall biosynthesis
VIEHGANGFVVETLDEAIDATRHIGRIDRRRCRATFERRFTATRMASRYVQIYREVMADISPQVA